MKNLQFLKVSENRRFLIHEDGSPFFWLGDTAWELFHKLNREEAEKYLLNRAKQKFNVIQAVALAELEGITTNNAYGRKPLKMNAAGNYDPAIPDVEGAYSYWEHVDFIIKKAESLDLYIALLPTWGDKYHKAWGKGPEIFDADNARIYGKWLGERYRDQANIIWVLGGDRPLTERKHFQIIQALAEGIKVGDNGKHLITFHPPGGASSSYNVHNEAWLDFNMIQSGHGDGERNNYKKVQADYKKIPITPTIDAEPCYEDHPRGFNPENGYFDESDVRKAAYYAVFSGAFGHTYGHHSVWSMSPGQYRSVEFSEPGSYFIMDWEEAILRPGASQMGYLRELIEARSSFLDRIPNQDLIIDNYAGSNYMVGTSTTNDAMIYSPNGLNINVQLGYISGKKVLASWFDPKTGEYTTIGDFENNGEIQFSPPSSGRGCDWVLVLERIINK